MKILGKTNLHTPRCVFEYLTKYYNVEYNHNYINSEKYNEKFYDICSEINIIEIENDEIKEHVLKNCIYLLNPQTKEKNWDLSKIKTGINFFISILKGNFSFNDDLTFGEKKQNSLFVLNEIECFILCSKEGFKLSYSTTHEDMFNYLKNYYTDSEKYDNIKISILNTLKKIEKKEIVQLYVDFSKIKQKDDDEDIFLPVIDNSKSSKKYSFSKTNIMFTNNFVLLTRIIPQTNEEAILIGMYLYGINLIESENPIFQFLNIKKENFNQFNIQKYVPKEDKLFCYRFSLNPLWYSTNDNWCDELINIYDRQKLIHLCKEDEFCFDFESYSNFNLIDFLKTKRNITWIYYGIIPYTKETRTTISLIPFEECNVEEIFTIGNYNKNELIFCTVKDLIDHFKIIKMPIHPTTKERLSDDCLTKINKRLNYLGTINKSRKHIYQELFNVIQETLNVSSYLTDNFHNLYLFIKNSENEEKENVISLLRKISEFAFYLRGWKVKDSKKFPLKTEDSYLSREYDSLIDMNSCNCYSEILQIEKKINHEILDTIKNLNCFFFSNKEEYKHAFGKKLSGLMIDVNTTIYSLIEISIHGNKKLITSCIRKNSNVILFSVSFYMFLCGIELDYDFNDIDELI